MFIYIFLFTIIAICALLESHVPTRTRKNLFWFCVVVLIAVVGTRECGGDYISYKNDVETGMQFVSWPFGYKLLINLCGYEFVVFLSTVVNLITIGYVVTKCTKHPNTFLLFYMAFLFFSGLMEQGRQGAAIGLIVLSFYLRDNKIRALLCIILGMIFFHPTCIVGIIYLFAPSKVFPFYVYLILYIVLIFVSKLSEIYLSPILESSGIEYVIKMSEEYQNRQEQMELKTKMIEVMDIFVLSLILIVSHFKHTFKSFRMSKFRSSLLNLAFLYLAAKLVFLPLADLSMRIRIYFMAPIFLLGSFIFDDISKLSSNSIKPLYYIYVYVFLLYKIFVSFETVISQNSVYKLIPYESIMF